MVDLLGELKVEDELGGRSVKWFRRTAIKAYLYLLKLGTSDFVDFLIADA